MKKHFLLIVLLSGLFIFSQNFVFAQLFNPQDYVVDIFITDDGGNCGEIPSPVYQFSHTLLHVVVDINRLQQDFNIAVVTLNVDDANNTFIGWAGYVIPENNPPQTSDLRGRIHGTEAFDFASAHAPTARPWSITLNFIDNVTFEEYSSDPIVIDPAEYLASCARLPYIGIDGNILPINEGNSENEVAVYNAKDDNGDPTLHIYDINDEGDGTLALEITQGIIAPYIDNPPAENTALMTSDNGKVTLYVLDTGELQINSGPDAEGKIHVLIFDGIPPTNIYGYVIDPITTE
ncbi:MAG: hypothetical protein RLP44_24750 [Aggregatilineales bacterium]